MKNYDLSNRIKRIREMMQLKQNAVATELSISQQAYSILESGNDIRLSTLTRICQVFKIDLAFLLSYDLPITEENIELAREKKYAALMKENKMLSEIVEREIFKNNYLANNIMNQVAAK
jgi:transcriptional regulator with XRE-family HTH domain